MRFRTAVLGVVLCAPPLITVGIACQCSFDSDWLNSVGSIFMYFIHAIFLALLYGILLIVGARYEWNTYTGRLANCIKIVVPLSYLASAIVGWLIVGYALIVSF